MRGKEKELKARVAHFLAVARQILLNEGYQGVSINRLAQETGFSKSTVYQSFNSKEELVTLLGLECRARLLDMVQKAAGIEGRARERMVALGEAMVIYSKVYADDQRILKLIDSEAVLEGVSEDLKDEMESYDVAVFSVLAGVIQDAVKAGDLQLRPGLTVEGLALAFWALIDGSFAAGMGGAPLEKAGVTDATAEVIRHAHYLMDGHGWRPLLAECDYTAVSQRVRAMLLDVSGSVKSSVKTAKPKALATFNAYAR